MEKEKEDIIKINNHRCINALILCAIIISSVFIGVVTKLVAKSTILDPDEGIRSFRYFTVLSNMFLAFATTLCIPFEIDGLRNHNYHLPRWIVETLYCAVCCVTTTFTIAICLLAPTQGVSVTLFEKANLFLHLIAPVTAMIMFIFINDDHNVPFKHSFLILIPLVAYAIVYWYEAFVLGVENGGWRDMYSANTYMPYIIPMIALPLIGLGLANIVRVLHNKRHKKAKQDRENYYLTSPVYDCADIKEAIKILAIREKAIDRNGDVIVPRRIIIMLEKRYQSGLPLDELCNTYLLEYLHK